MTSADSVEGKIGRALDLSGVNDYVGVSMNHPETNYTYGLWIKTNVMNQGISRVASPLSPTSGAHDRNLAIDGSGNVRHRLWNCSEIITTSGINVADNNWHLITVVVESGTGQKIYVNGVERASGICDHSDFNWEVGLIIGGDAFLQTNTYFNGLIDEVRISNIARSPAWIQASFHSGQGTLLTYGVEEYKATLTFSISDNTIGFGIMPVNAVRYATGDTLGSATEPGANLPVNLIASTNSPNG